METKYPFFKNTSRTPPAPPGYFSALLFEAVRAACDMAVRSWLWALLRGRKTQLLLVNMLTCGLEICMATGTSCVPPLLLEAGIEEQFMSMVLGVGPVLGLLFVPMISSASDRWTGHYGRRRPFIWLLCLGVLLSLILIPHASLLAGWLSVQSKGLEVALLITGICLLEFCGLVCFTLLEALVSDLFQDEEGCRQAFAMHSLMISLGGCIGYLLPAVDWKSIPLVPSLGGQETFIFVLLTLILLFCVLGTAFVSEEVFKSRGEFSVVESRFKCRCPCLLSFRLRHLLSALRSCCALLPRLRQLCHRVPRVIRQLFVAELCSWMALMTFILFYTDFIGEGLYKGVPNAKPGSAERLRYDEGVRMGSLGLLLQCATSAMFSLFLGQLVKKLGPRAVYLSSVAFLTFATLVMSLSHSLVLITAMAGMTGYTFCTLQILPYTLASLYHSEQQVFFSQHNTTGATAKEEGGLTHKPSYTNGHPGGMPGLGLPLPASPLALHVPVRGDGTAPPAGPGICLDLAILDSAFMLSQVVPSLFMGSIVHFSQCVAAYMGCASAIGLVAIYVSTKVVFEKSDLCRSPDPAPLIMP
ncbi:solute carrier family 45 member 3-like [Polyodon spathula]|uniref:solute carrier family 45 member 3-like n=1 Tax=Polyodon spathula TaxID=7913 RepID=UPI001B7DDE46|nr:solute carrier family 45 member 3-like [Polyodon spathula]